MVPRFKMRPGPLPLKERALLFRLASSRFKVEATKPPTLICEPLPNKMPFGLTR